MTEELRTTLHRIADATAPLPVSDDLWRGGRAARRRGQVLAAAAVLALVASVGGIATLTATSDREARTASSEVVPEGAIPSRIEDPGDLTATTDLAVGKASVAFIDSATDVVVVGATDGRYHALALPEAPLAGPVRLSPDGRLLAYAWTEDADGEGAKTSGTSVLDLGTGEVRRIPAETMVGDPVSVSTLAWSPDSSLVAWWGRRLRQTSDSAGRSAVGLVDARTGGQSVLSSDPGHRARSWALSVNDSGWLTLVSRDRAEGWVIKGDGDGGGTAVPLDRDLPGGDPGTIASRQPTGVLTVVGATSTTRAVPFVTEEGEVVERRLDRGLYPAGATRVSPLGWATDSLVLAQLDGPAGSYVEGSHLALLTSPDRPKSEWTYRIVMRDIADVAELSVAVDLVPDLDGTSAQPLTHDFGDVLAPDQRDISWIIGLGVAAAIAVLLGLRRVWRRSYRTVRG